MTEPTERIAQVLDAQLEKRVIEVFVSHNLLGHPQEIASRSRKVYWSDGLTGSLILDDKEVLRWKLNKKDWVYEFIPIKAKSPLEKEERMLLTPWIKAPTFLEKAAQHMKDRAKTYDKPEGERSMAQTVIAFNAIVGQDLTEAQGWEFMACLKKVRSWQRPGFHSDSHEDCIAYDALLAEAKQKEV